MQFLLRNHDVHGDEDGSMILMSVVIVDYVILNKNVYCMCATYLACFPSPMRQGRILTNTNHTAKSHDVGNAAGSACEANSHLFSLEGQTAQDEAQTRGIANHRRRHHLRMAAHRAAIAPLAALQTALSARDKQSRLQLVMASKNTKGLGAALS